MDYKLSKSKLQRALTGLSNANNRAFAHREKIYNHCMQVYGADPADIDNDLFIDSCDGGEGTCCGMTVEEFEESMEDLLTQTIS